MNDWIGLGIIAFLILCALLGLWGLSRPYNVTTEEFERRAKEGPGLIGASLVGLQKALDPAMQKAVEAQEDFKRGRYNKEDESGDPPEGGDDRREDRTERGSAG
jgi:hypothetical protein